MFTTQGSTFGRSPIQTLPMGTLQDHLRNLFGPQESSLWSRIKRDAFNQILERHVLSVITSEEERFKIILAYFRLETVDLPRRSEAFQKIQDFAMRIEKGPILISDIGGTIERLVMIKDHKVRDNEKYLSDRGISLISNLIVICEWLCSRIREEYAILVMVQGD